MSLPVFVSYFLSMFQIFINILLTATVPIINTAMLLKKYTRLFCTTFNPYKILQADKNTSPQQLKTKYYELAQQYHPDRNPQHLQKFKQINQAYQMLRDPQKRKQIDHDIEHKGAPVRTKSNYGMYRQAYGHGYNKNGQQQALRMQREKARQSMANGYGWQQRDRDGQKGMGYQWVRGGQKMSSNQRLKQKHGTIRVWLTVSASVVLIFVIVEMVFRVYEFNTRAKKLQQSGASQKQK